MSVEGYLQRTVSPATSGRNSPVTSRFKFEREETSIKKDKNYRRYASGVERALSLFDTALQEWADYISFLGRLLKALQLRPSGISDVPHKRVVAKRLSQCLDPSLPSGVHQKALEVYTYIFSLLGKDGLGRDLSLYLPGISPALSFAALSIKPSLLSLFDTFILAVDPTALRPALKAILLALLPGLEEETSEEFGRVLQILGQLKRTIANKGNDDQGQAEALGDQFFWQCVFLATITSPTRRQGVLAYLLRHLPNLGKPIDANSRLTDGNGASTAEFSRSIEAVTSPEPGLLVRCFAAGLSDDQLLIQRGFLDLLVSRLPLHSTVLQRKVTSDDLRKLVAAAASVVARREMSLNKRLWVWFLGPHDASSDSQSASASPERSRPNGAAKDTKLENAAGYFERFGLDPLVASILEMLKETSEKGLEKARPFRICLSLMDRWEIGGLVVPQVFLPALESVRQYEEAAPTPDLFAEVLRSANVFFDGVESGLIWRELTRSLMNGFGDHNLDLRVAHQRLDLIIFTLARFNVKVEEMLQNYLPMLAVLLLIKTRNVTRKISRPCDPQHPELVRKSLKTVGQILDLVPERALKPTPSNGMTEKELDLENQKYFVHLEKFYGRSQGDLGSADYTKVINPVGKLLILNCHQMVLYELRSERLPEYFETELSVLDKAFHKLSAKDFLSKDSTLTCLTQHIEQALNFNGTEIVFRNIIAVISFLEIFSTTMASTTLLSDHRLRVLLPQLLKGIWEHLSPSRPRYNVEAARCVWRTHALSLDQKLVEACVAGLMLSSSDSVSLENARKFEVLWAHSTSSPGAHGRRSSLVHTTRKMSSRLARRTRDSFTLERPLLLLLDSLRNPKTELYNFVSDWLQSLQDPQVIVDTLLRRLQSSSCMQATQVHSSSTENSRSMVDIDECLYYLETVSHVSQCPGKEWSILSDEIFFADQEYYRETQEPHTRAEQEPQVDQGIRVRDYLVQICLEILGGKHFDSNTKDNSSILRLRQVAISLLEQAVLESHFQGATEKDIEIGAIAALETSVKRSDLLLQNPLMRLVFICLQNRFKDRGTTPAISHRRIMSGDSLKGAPRRSVSVETNLRESPAQAVILPPPKLLDCLILGISSHGSQPELKGWVNFLDECLPFYASDGFQILMPLAECFSKTIREVFHSLRSEFEMVSLEEFRPCEPVKTLVVLLNGFERVLARSHDRLVQIESSTLSTKAPEQVHGFFGSMVSGVFTADSSKVRIPTANNRLTVLLCFKDAVKVCYEIWSWGDATPDSPSHDPVSLGTLKHTSLRLRNRTRRILEHMFAAEALEGLESLIELWDKLQRTESQQNKSRTILDLLHVLDGSRPKNTIPAIFNALYSRTNPAALDPIRKSTLTSDLTDTTLAKFLVAYTQSLEDDAMDEIWTDCMTFLRDILTNPLPHRQTLPKLLEFTAILGEKVDNTSFGEQRKMRRELGDIFVRQLAATFTTKPLSFLNESSSSHYSDPKELLNASGQGDDSLSEDIVTILARITPKFPKILTDADRIVAATNTVSTQVLAATLRWKTFPRNVTPSTLDIMLALSRVPEASKSWRKDVGEAFNDSRLFCRQSFYLAKGGWLPVFRQWVLLDKDRLSELLSRIPSPTSAGIMFGVGASSARNEADRKAQLNLRRTILLIAAAANDSFVVNLGIILEKVVDLLTATAASSPSSATRAEICVLLRALILKTSSVHLASFWPIITTELYDALSSLISHERHDTFNVHSVLQACKLLDVVLVIAPEEFQLREWLFVTDTIDAVYRPQGWDSVALTDEIADELDLKAGAIHSTTTPVATAAQAGRRKPLLTSRTVMGVAKENLVDQVLRPFFRQLSINTFESTYSIGTLDWEACFDDLLFDLFDDSTLV